MQEQTQYASKRRKTQPKQQVMRPIQHAADILHDDDTLIAEASNSLSRFWAHLSSLLSSDASKTQRLSMLSLTHKLFKHMVDTEDVVLSKGINNVPEVLSKYLLAFNNFQVLKESLKMLAESNLLAATPDQAPPPPSDNEPTQSQEAASAPVETDNLAKPAKPAKPESFPFPSEAGELTPEDLKKHVIKMTSFGLSNEDIRPFLDIFHQRRKEKNENKKDLMSDRLKDIYQDLFKKVIVQKTSEFLSDIEITKQSGNYLTRLLKKYRHQFGTKEPSSAARMEIYELIRNIKILLDETMNLLEKKKINIKEVISKISEVDKLFVKMESPLKILNMLYSDKYYERNDKFRGQPVADPLDRHFNRQIRRNVDNLGR